MRTRFVCFFVLLLLSASAFLLWPTGEEDVAMEGDRAGVTREPNGASAEPARERAPAPARRSGTPVSAAEEPERTPPGALENEMLVRFPTTADRRAFLEEMAGLDARLLESIPGLNAVRIRYGDPSVAARLRERLPRGAEAGHNFLVLSPTLPPPVENTAGGPYLAFGDTALRWLGVPEDNSEWGRGVRVAILDTGVSPHVTFGGAFTPEFDLLGDEASGASYAGHGTAVASLLTGSDGVAPAVDLMSFKVLDGDGGGNTFHLAKGIVEAVNRGARVIPMALGTFGDSAVLRDAVAYALERDTILVAAAGNEGVQGLPYPARYDGVLAVTAVDANGRRAPFANAGPEVDLAAPGVGLRAAWGEDEFVEFSGTSASVPLVAGAIAGILSEEPNLRSADIFRILAENADDIGAPGRDSFSGDGNLNLDRVINRNETGIHDLAVADFYLDPGGDSAANPLQVTVQNRGTEAARNVVLEVDVDGNLRTFSLGSIDRNEVRTAEIPVSPERLQSPDGIEIRARTSASGVEDSRPDNDTKGARLRLEPPADEEE